MKFPQLGSHQRKKNLIITLATRIRRICSPEIVDEELGFLKEILIKSRYPSIFIDKNMKPKTQIITVEKKTLYMNIDFKGDRATYILKRRISDPLKRTFFAATFQILFSSLSMFAKSLKDKLSHLTNSMCIYQFTCSCETRYIGRSMRTLSRRIQEHYVAWLKRGGNGSIRSPIIEHLVNTGHSIKADSAFKVIFKVSRSLPKTIRRHLLCITEAIAIHLEKPELCVQKRLVQPLLLPWS
ncbi:Alpha-(1,6)-fucosyltransferase [Schistosoma haematobium]|uniref:Alpha-(1,6)-fucosyltransferase n=1 Tax=Schistosoma haematobium TaxID=6185 RepID=A0A922INT4_SCHHA|nr:Alpha-(1,6)-fucosyltransferase [Schistosoma haematobium]KAH9583632.1 Alpha-(1,6)-fucosyltransferase [Schistosoma haematobium]